MINEDVVLASASPRWGVIPAQAGIYDATRISGFTDNHRKSGARSSLSDYYTAAYGAVVFDKSLRKRAVFSDHSLVSDQVFAEVE